MDDKTIVEFRPKPVKTAGGLEPITLKNYDEMALKFAQMSGPGEFPIVTPASPECVAWERYFDRQLGGRPWAYRALLAGQIQMMTVPTQWPEWFDPSYAGTT